MLCLLFFCAYNVLFWLFFDSTLPLLVPGIVPIDCFDSFIHSIRFDRVLFHNVCHSLVPFSENGLSKCWVYIEPILEYLQNHSVPILEYLQKHSERVKQLPNHKQALPPNKSQPPHCFQTQRVPQPTNKLSSTLNSHFHLYCSLIDTRQK
jgi:hypothetical protein